MLPLGAKMFLPTTVLSSPIRGRKSLGAIQAILCCFLVVLLVSVSNAAEMTRITLAWDPSDDRDVAGFNIYRRTASNPYWKLVGTIENASSPEISLNVSYGKKYYFVVTAYDVHGNESSFSNRVSWPIQVLSPNGGEIRTSGSPCPIQWYADSVAEEFELLYSLNKGRSWYPIITLTGSFRTYEWIVPEVVKTKTKCKVKVVLRGTGGVILGSDVSDAYFRVNPY
jgi:hypothetical protein